MTKVRFSERDVRFSASKLLEIGKKYGLLHRWRHAVSTPSMVLVNGPAQIEGWNKSEGDLCYVVMEKYTQGWLLSLNRTNWLKWILIPEANLIEMCIIHHGKSKSGQDLGHLYIKTSSGDIELEILYGQIEQVRQVIGQSNPLQS